MEAVRLIKDREASVVQGASIFGWPPEFGPDTTVYNRFNR
jgi:hypothetical protein